MNFPKKNPMKMAAMTTRREGREAVVASRPRRLVEFVVMWSERGAFLILIPSSCKKEKTQCEERVSQLEGITSTEEGMIWFRIKRTNRLPKFEG